MAWVDLFVNKFGATTLDTRIYWARYQSWANSGPTIDPSSPEVLAQYCGADVMFYEPADTLEVGIGGVIYYNQAPYGGQPSWNFAYTHFFSNLDDPTGSVGTPFVDARIRVRSRFVGNRNPAEDPYEWSVDGAGIAGFVWMDDEGNTYIDERIGRFTLAAWGVNDAVNDWSTWYEYTVTGEESNGEMTYMGIGHTTESVYEGFGPPRDAFIVEWQIWVDEPLVLVANPDSSQTQENTPVTINVLSNDTLNGEQLSLDALDGLPVISVAAQNGTVVVNNDGTVTYTPNIGFSGTDTFTYQIEVTNGCAVVNASNRDNIVISNLSFDIPSNLNYLQLTDDLEIQNWQVALYRPDDSSPWYYYDSFGSPPWGTTLDGVIYVNDDVIDKSQCAVITLPTGE